MNISSCRLISAVVACVLVGCTAEVQQDHPATTQADSVVTVSDLFTVKGADDLVTQVEDSLQDTTRHKTDLELRRERDLQRKKEFHDKWTGRQLDSMRSGKTILPAPKVSPEKQHYLDSIQKTLQGGKKKDS